MNLLLEKAVPTLSDQDSDFGVSASSHLSQVESISFRQCAGISGRVSKTQKSHFDYSWNRILTKIQDRSQSHGESAPVQKEQKTYERRETSRHSSEAIVLALGNGKQVGSHGGGLREDKGYVINVSRNGISFASRSQFLVRDELQLHVENPLVKCSFEVTVSVLRVTSLDDHFWRIDCKLLNPLSDQQVLQLKKHASSCYAG